jgi:hypothetical protein
MMLKMRWMHGVTVAFALLLTPAGRMSAQCRPPSASNEARLLAFYSGPIAFSPFRTPEVLEAAAIVAGLEVVLMPDPSDRLTGTGTCFTRQTPTADLAPSFVRPRFTFGLARGLELEASYVPPIRISGVEPNIASAALSWTRPLRSTWTGGAPRVTVRAHGTVGRVRGAITCPSPELQQSNPAGPCYGSRESRDTFEPNMFGLEAGAAWETVITGLAGYAGAGVNWLRPRFQVGFTDANGSVDTTRVYVDLTRFVVFTGVTWHAARPFEVSAQAYSAPEDVTAFRIAGAYKFR